MDILSAAGYLIQRAVTTASQLQQHNREKETKTVAAQPREKQGPTLTEQVTMPTRSSAYRVTLSAAAQQQLIINPLAS